MAPDTADGGEAAAAALLIQRCWRHHRTRRAVQQQQQQPDGCSVELDWPRHMQHAQQLADWRAFAQRQARRYVALPPDAARRTLQQPLCHRLRVLAVAGLPALPPTSSAAAGAAGPDDAAASGYELQLSVSLFDAATGCFYGATAASPAREPLPARPAGGEPAVDVECMFEVFWTSAIADPRCVAVVELVLVDSAVPGSGFSLGWAQLPLCAPPGPAAAAATAEPCTAQVVCGTPRYLLLSSVCGEEGLAPPAVLEGCHVVFQAEAWPPMAPAAALLPPDFPVTPTDVVPGLRRFDAAGLPTTALKGAVSSLAAPLLAPACAVDLAGLQLLLPQLLHNLLSVLPQLRGTPPPPNLAALLAVPCQPAAVSYALRLGLHNGRTFVGPQITRRLQVQPRHLGSLMLELHGPQQLRLDWLLADRLMVLVLELLAAPAAEGGEQQDAVVDNWVLVGSAVLAPFEAVAPDGGTAVLAEGRHRVRLDASVSLSSMPGWGRSGCQGAFACPLGLGLAGGEGSAGLPLNWRALLHDSAARAVADPEVVFDLAAADRHPQLPQGSPGCWQEPAAADAAAGDGTAVDEAAAGGVDAATAGLGGLQLSAAVAAGAGDGTARTAAAGSRPPSPSAAAAAAAAPAAGESRAARSLQLAARHLEEAANIPVETPSASTLACTLPATPLASRPDAAAAGAGSGLPGQQLQQLADTMQSQLDLLARAVAELKEERQTLRSSLTLLESAAAAASEPAPRGPQGHISSPGSAAAAAAAAGAAAAQREAGLGSELEWVDRLQPAGGSPLGAQELASFAGLPVAQLGAGGAGSAPSRAVLQQLHEAGMTQALPHEVQALLRAQGASRPHAWLPQPGPGQLPLLLDLEARDPRTASDVVLQLLAFRPAPGPAAAARLPPGLARLHFTLSLFDSGPVLTQPCGLAAAPGSGGGGGAPADAGAPPLLVLLPEQQQQQQQRGMGLVLKFQFDGSGAGQLLPGQDPAQAGCEAHLALCRYLASHALAVDVWDGDSLLQLGTASVQLHGLLRRGRELVELLVEVPVLQACSQPPGEGGCTSDAGAAQLGSLLVRLINIGRQPASAAAQLRGFDVAAGPSTPGKKVRVRAAPFEPSSPVAKELRAGRGPFTNGDWQQQPSSQDGAWEVGSPDGAQAAGSSAGAGGGDDTAAAAAADILSLEQRKLARERQLHQLLHSPRHTGAGGPSGSPGGSPGAPAWAGLSPPPPVRVAAGLRPPGAAPAEAWPEHSSGGEAGDSFRSVQRQLLADVDAVRKRQKPGFLRAQLRKGLVRQFALRPSPGQALLLEHVLVNTLGRDAVFELRITHPSELAPVESLQELRALQQALGPPLSTTGGPAPTGALGCHVAGGGAAAPPPSLAALASGVAHKGAGAAPPARELASGSRIFLAANERAAIPLCFRLLPQEQEQPPLGLQPGSSSGGSSPAPQQQQQRIVSVEFVPAGQEWPLCILELLVRPRRLVIDRTLRLHGPERELLHVELPLLPGSASADVLAAAAAGQLLVAASRADVRASISGPAAGPSTPQAAAGAAPASPDAGQAPRMCIRCRCGAAPGSGSMQFVVWLYADAAMAQPLEAWQVFVRARHRVDMRAVLGQASSTSLAIAGGAAERLVACYSSRPDELQPSPQLLSLPAGGCTALHLTFKPRAAGHAQACVHLVDVTSRQLVHALLVATEAQLPPMHRRLELRVQAGSVAQHTLQVANPSASRPARLLLRTNVPALLSFAQGAPPGASPGPAAGSAVLALPPGGVGTVGLVCDARALAPGADEAGLVFVCDQQLAESGLHDECVVVALTAV